MYKQPTNKHRVLAMKDKFENKMSNNSVQNNLTLSEIKNNNNNMPQRVVLNNNNATECTNTNIMPYLPKQINGVPKRIVKRSEAFRRDKNSSESVPSFQRNFALRTSYRTKNIDDKIKLFNSSNADAPLQRSGSFSDLYSTPQRKGNFIKENESKSLIADTNNDKCDNRIQESFDEEVDSFQNVTKTISNCNKTVVGKHLESHLVSNSLQETFKEALKKPLPAGPAPSKPPRTFQYSPNQKLIENGEHIKIAYNREKPPILTKESLFNKPPSKIVKSDPKYMLDKLETALKNNKMKLKRQDRIDPSITSEDEIDADSPKFDLKGSKLREFNCKMNLAFDDKSEGIGSVLLNCFKPEESRKEKKWEPIYAEPFHHNKIENNVRNERPNTNRNSLYYMSSPIVLINKEQTVDFNK